MLRLNLRWTAILCVAFMAIPTVWCAEGATVANALELELIKKQAAEREKWVSQGSVTKSEVVGKYEHFPFDWKAFALKGDGTGTLHGGARGTGNWKIMWAYDEKSGMLVIQSQQVKRQYKAIKKDGSVWMIEGREVWRQGANHNALIPFPRDKARQVGN